jgi:hypothetical protein
MYIKLFLLILAGLLIVACGEGKVSVDPEQYEPKIAIEGLLFPHKQVNRFYIWRNFRVNANLRRTSLALPNADVTITDLQSGNSYPLTYLPDSAYFKYLGSDLIIDYGKSYRLDVAATIEGKKLRASSTTTVPNPGLEIVSLNHDTLSYYQRDTNGNIINFNIGFERSPGTNFYLVTILALDADVNTFVYDNPFTEETPEDVAGDLDDFRYNYGWIQDTPTTPGQSSMEIFWFDLWFYSRYEVILYAADKNYQDFLKTYNEVREIDGNYHEPVFHIEGDGVGVFGSAVIDTVYLKVVE